MFLALDINVISCKKSELSVTYIQHMWIVFDHCSLATDQKNAKIHDTNTNSQNKHKTKTQRQKCKDTNTNPHRHKHKNADPNTKTYKDT